MNIEIANRLVQLRKQNNLSQEALAAQLGISRQAVSKWERAEASPDTDNLILLARLYRVSLDDLLQTEDEIPQLGGEVTETETEADDTENRKSEQTGEEEAPEEYVHVSLKGVHVKDKDGSEVHVGWDGIHVKDKKENNDVCGHIFVNGEEQTQSRLGRILYAIPYPIFIIVLYLALGLHSQLWHPGWIVFLTIPLWYTLVSAVVHRNANYFAYPILAAVVFLYIGCTRGLWHPGWIVFLTVPIYYWLVNLIQEQLKIGE